MEVMRVAMDMTHIMLDPQETASEHLEVVLEDRRVILVPVSSLFPNHLVVEVDLLAEQEEEDLNLLR
jgi:hypothetical protein